MSGREVARSLARPTINGIAVRAVGLTLGLGVAAFLARNLGAQDLGAYQGVLSIGVILGSLAAATAERPVARRIAGLDEEDPQELPREVLLAHVVVAIAIVAIVLVLVVGSLIPAIPEEVRVTLRLAALVAPGIAILSLRQWIALPLQGVAASLAPEQIGQPIVFLGLAGLAAYATGLAPAEALLIYGFVCWLVWFVSSWRSGLLRLLREGIGERLSGPRLRARFREGRTFVLLTAVGVLPTYATVPIVAALLNLADAGRLAIALQLTVLVTVPLQIVSLAIMPRCARLHRDGETAGLKTLVRSASSISFASGLLLAALLLLTLDTILGVLGPSFAATRVLVPVLVIGQLVNAALGPNGPTLQMIGMERQTTSIETAVTVVRLAAVAFAASTGSILGVVVAIAATTILRNVLLSAALYRRTGILTLPQIPHRRVPRR